MIKPASISEIKNELKTLRSKEVFDLCIRLAKYKKENKELLSYLLFEANDEMAYVQSIKDEMDNQFQEINTNIAYYAKKGFQKVLRNTNKYIKYSGVKQTEVELRIYYCQKLKKSGVSLSKNVTINNLYQRQILKIQKAMISLHEDLQHDYGKLLEELIKGSSKSSF